MAPDRIFRETAAARRSSIYFSAERPRRHGYGVNVWPILLQRMSPLLAVCHEYRRSIRRCVKRWRRALRGRQLGVDLKPPQAAVVKSDGGERCGNGGTRSRQARLREASASKPLMTCRKRIRRCQNRGVAIPSGLAWEMPETAQAASGMEAARSSTRRLYGT